MFEARIGETSETLQVRCMDCGKKRDRSPSRLEPLSTKRVKTYLGGNKGSMEGFSSRVSTLFCEHCKKCHPSKC